MIYILWIIIIILLVVNISFNHFSNNDKKTLVMGYWYVENNKKRNHLKYVKRINNIFNFFNKQNVDIIFYYNDDYIKNMIEDVNTNNIKFIKRNIEELPTYKYSLKLLNLCKNQDNNLLALLYNGKLKDIERGVTHYKRELNISGDEAYRKIITIWTSKLFLIKECIDNKYFDNKYIGWNDLAYFNNYLYRNNYDKIKTISNTVMKYYGKQKLIKAGIIFGNINYMNQFIDKYSDELYNNTDELYCHDEETIMQKVYLKHRYLFDTFNKNDIQFIHIGKTGGSTLIDLFKLNQIHMKKVKYNKNIKYITIIRNPIKRIVSAFNMWASIIIHNNYKGIIPEYRYNLYKKNGYHISPEYDNLIKTFNNINNLAESLTSEDINKKKLALKLFNSPLEHINKGIGYYLNNGDFIDTAYDNIIYVATQENLDKDIINISDLLNIEINNYENKRVNNNVSKYLSPKAIENIKTYLKDTDYKALNKLYQYGYITKKYLDYCYTYEL